MCGRNSQWLGPRRRIAEFGNEHMGTRRGRTPNVSECAGFHKGARVYNRFAAKVRP